MGPCTKASRYYVLLLKNDILHTSYRAAILFPYKLNTLVRGLYGHTA